MVKKEKKKGFKSIYSKLKVKVVMQTHEQVPCLVIPCIGLPLEQVQIYKYLDKILHQCGETHQINQTIFTKCEVLNTKLNNLFWPAQSKDIRSVTATKMKCLR